MAEAFVQLTGFAEHDKKLRQLEPKLAKKVLRKAMSAAAEPVRKEAARLAPRGDTGQLSRNIVKNVKRKKSIVVAKVGAAAKVFYAIFLEFGTFHSRREPLLRPRKGKAARSFARGVQGVQMQPFLRPAWDAKKGVALRTLGEKIGSELERLARK